MCRKLRQHANLVQETPEIEAIQPEEDELPLFNISVVKPSCPGGAFNVEVMIDRKPVVMELDTGASVSLVSEKTWKATFPGVQLKPSQVRLSTYSVSYTHLTLPTKA